MARPDPVDYPRRVRPVALTIAGSDPTGGAGLQADLLTFTALGVHGASVATALTAQDTRGVRATDAVAPGFVSAQLDAVLDDLDVRAVKTGMLHRGAVVHVVAARLSARKTLPLVVDPVIAASDGAPLLDAAGVESLRTRLLPLATLVTPNLAEAAALTGLTVDGPAAMADAARALVALGARAALVTGGHLEGDAVDVLHDGHAVRELRAPRIPGPPVHGTGCAFAAASAARLACGAALPEAVVDAKAFVARAITAAVALGRGARILGLADASPARDGDRTAGDAGSGTTRTVSG